VLRRQNRNFQYKREHLRHFLQRQIYYLLLQCISLFLLGFQIYFTIRP